MLERNIYRFLKFAPVISAVSGLAFLKSQGKEEQPIDTVIVSQNSGIFSGYSYKKLLENKNLNVKSDKLVIVAQDFWLDNVHPSRLDTKWGQNYIEFPLLARKAMEEEFPDIQGSMKQDRIKFRDKKYLRDCIKHYLSENLECDVIEGGYKDLSFSRSILEKIEDQFLDHLFDFYPYRHNFESLESDHKNKEKIWFPVTTKNSEEIHRYATLKISDGTEKTYTLSNRFSFFNFSNKPRINPLIYAINSGKDLPDHTEIYKLPKGKEPDKIILFGSGLSAIWLCEQAPKSEIFMVAKAKESSNPPDIARNKNTDLKKMRRLNLDESEFVILNEAWLNKKTDNSLEVRRKKSILKYANLHQCDIYQNREDQVLIAAFVKSSDEVLAIGVAYNAIGYIPDKAIGEYLPESVLVNVHYDREQKIYSPKNLPGGALFDRVNDELRVLIKEKYPKVFYENPLIFIDLQALFFREQDKSVLVSQLDVDLNFINYLFHSITQLEDTPVNPPEFIKTQFVLWLKQNHPIVESSVVDNFNTKLDQLFEQRELYYGTRSSKEEVPVSRP